VRQQQRQSAKADTILAVNPLGVVTLKDAHARVDDAQQPRSVSLQQLAHL